MHFPHGVQVLESLEGLPAHVRDLDFGEGTSDLVDVLQTATATELHADPQFVPSQVRSVVGDDVRVAAVPHHDDLLLDDLYVVGGLQLDDLDGGQLIALYSFRLQEIRYCLESILWLLKSQ